MASPAIRLFYPAIQVGKTMHELRVPLGNRYLGEGPQVKRLEQAFQELSGAPRAPVGLNSGTTALELALHLTGVEHLKPRIQAKVISTPMTCLATNAAIIQRGGSIEWADIDPCTGNIDPGSVNALFSEYNTEAIVAVDWGGRSCDYNALKRFGVPVIQDAAHNLLYDPDNCGDYVCWSLQAIKNLTAGDGGMLLCPDDATTARARRLRWYGYDRDSGADFRCEQDVEELGWKWHMNDVAASIALANLSYPVDCIGTQRENAAYYHERLAGVPGVTLPPYDPRSCYWLMTLLVDDRADFQRFLSERGIETSRAHRRNDDYTAMGGPAQRGVLPGVDWFDEHQINIPGGWWLDKMERGMVADAVVAWGETRT